MVVVGIRRLPAKGNDDKEEESSVLPISYRSSCIIQLQLYFTLLHFIYFVEFLRTPVITQVIDMQFGAGVGVTCHWKCGFAVTTVNSVAQTSIKTP